jgi:hypothetical protein
MWPYLNELRRFDVNEETDSFYVPHHIAKEGAYTFPYNLSLSLRLVIPSDFKMGLQDPEALGNYASIFAHARYFHISAAKCSLNISAYRLHQSIIDMKKVLGWIRPVCDDWSRLNMSISHELQNHWMDADFPALDATVHIPFPPLIIPCESAFWPFQVRWSRPIRKAATGTTVVRKPNPKLGSYNIETEQKKFVNPSKGKKKNNNKNKQQQHAKKTRDESEPSATAVTESRPPEGVG